MQSRERSEGFFKGPGAQESVYAQFDRDRPRLEPQGCTNAQGGREKEIFFATRQTPIFANGALDFTNVENGKCNLSCKKIMR